MLSPGDTKYLFISPLKFNSFFFPLFLKWCGGETEKKLWTFDLICKSVGWVCAASGIVLIIKNQQQEKKRGGNLLAALLERTHVLFKSDYCSIWLFRFGFSVKSKKKRDFLVRIVLEISESQSAPHCTVGRAGSDERMGMEEVAACLICLQPNYMATNELPIMRIYCLVLSQELIKSTQLKAAMRKTLAVNRAFIQLIHDCQLK